MKMKTTIRRLRTTASDDAVEANECGDQNEQGVLVMQMKRTSVAMIMKLMTRMLIMWNGLPPVRAWPTRHARASEHTIVETKDTLA